MNASRSVRALLARHNTYTPVARFPRQNIATNHGTARFARRSSTQIHAPEITNPPYRSIKVTTPHRSASITRKISITLFSSDAHTIRTTSTTASTPWNTPIAHTPALLGLFIVSPFTVRCIS